MLDKLYIFSSTQKIVESRRICRDDMLFSYRGWKSCFGLNIPLGGRARLSLANCITTQINARSYSGHDIDFKLLFNVNLAFLARPLNLAAMSDLPSGI